MEERVGEEEGANKAMAAQEVVGFACDSEAEESKYDVAEALIVSAEHPRRLWERSQTHMLRLDESDLSRDIDAGFCSLLWRLTGSGDDPMMGDSENRERTKIQKITS